MTDKEKLKKELIRLKDIYHKRSEESVALQDGYEMYWGGVISAFDEIITLVDSLSEEEVSKDLEEVAEGIYDCNDIESWICFDGLVESISKVGEKVKVIIIKETEK